MADLQTVFGSINSVIDQTTNSILKIEQAQNQYKGNQPSMYSGAFGSTFRIPTYTSTQWVGIGLLVLVAGLIGYVLYREFK
jgi:hypothetical protein